MPGDEVAGVKEVRNMAAVAGGRGGTKRKRPHKPPLFHAFIALHGHPLQFSELHLILRESVDMVRGVGMPSAVRGKIRK